MRLAEALALDIETVPLTASLGVPYPEAHREPPGNYKADDAIARWREKDRAAWASERVKACSLSPRMGRVLTVGFAKRADDGTIARHHDYALTEADEPATLRRVVKVLGSVTFSGRTLMTWNGLGFDLPFIATRCAFHEITALSFAPLLKRWGNTLHADLKHLVLGGDVRRAGEGLDEWSKAFGLSGKTDGMDGSKVYDAYLRGDHAKVGEYVEDDAESTLRLGEFIAPVYL